MKQADTLDFAELPRRLRGPHPAARAHRQAHPRRPRGHDRHITNPGTIGTMHSVPRLMPGQGVIVGVGAIIFPPEYESADPQTLAELGVGKVVTLTSTYDHRIIQGAESGEMLAAVHDLLVGSDGFYDDIFASLGVPYEPARWSQDHRPVPGSLEGLEKVDRGAATREHVPRARSPDREPRSARAEEAAHAPRARPDPLGPHDLGPRARVPHGRARGRVDDEAPRHPRRAARRVRAHDRRRVHAHPGARSEGLDPGTRRRRAHRESTTTTRSRSSAGSTRPRPSSVSCTRSSSARSASASKARRRSSRLLAFLLDAAADDGHARTS